MSDDLLFSVCLTADKQHVDLLEDLFFESGYAMTSWEDAEKGDVVFQEYFEHENDAALRLAEADRLVSNLDASPEYKLELKRIASRDWKEYWKRFFHAVKVSNRVVIKPSWEEYKPEPDDLVVEIDPGMSFGTGLHPTTRMCISILDDMSESYKQCSLADLGCGSGILSIAAAKMGFDKIVGVDNDSLAVEIADANAKLNDVRVSFSVDDMQDPHMSEKYDVVVINMLASLLNQFAEDAVRLLKNDENSRLIISGMLKNQYDETIHKFETCGVKVLEAREQDEWKSALCCLV